LQLGGRDFCLVIKKGLLFVAMARHLLPWFKMYHGRVLGVRVLQIGADEDFINHIMSSKEYKK
jgi:hypothetical protein